MRNMFTALLTLLLTISFTLNSYADRGRDSTAANRLGIFDYVAPNPVEIGYGHQFFVGTPPKSFESIAPRAVGLKRHTNDIIARTEKDKTTLGLVPFGVIDTGGDVTNNKMRSMMMFDVENNQIKGAGKNYVSGNNWAFPHHIDPWIYAVGAQGITSDQANVRIEGALEQPLAYLFDLNDRVMKTLMTAISINPKLKNSFFAKINQSNTNIVGLFRLLNYQVNAEAVTQLLAQNKALRPIHKPENIEPALKPIFNYAKTAWIMSPDSGLPDFFSQTDLEVLHGLTELKQELIKIFETADGKAVIKSIGNTFEYMTDHHFKAGALPEIVQAYSMAKISQQIAYKKLGSQIFSPSFDFYMTMRRLRAANPNAFTWEQVIEGSLEGYSRILETMQQDGKTLRDRGLTATIQSLLASTPMVKKFIFGNQQTQDIEGVLKYIEEKGKLPWIENESSLQRKLALRTKIPGIHRDSQEEYHGTHTSSTPEGYLGSLARAIHYRIGLSLIVGNIEIQDQVVKKNLEAMHAWMQTPVVARGIHHKITQELGLPLNVDISTTDGQKKLAGFMTNRFIQYLALDASPSRSGLVGQNLLWEIVDAVKDMAVRKIPFGNLSIGGEVVQPAAHPTIDTPDEKIASIMDFLFGEFQKHVVAEAMATHGKNTLYFVAAGNANNIGEGYVRSNFPADLRPEWLKKFKDPGQTLPGENLKNIVVVESSNGEGRLSNFSNKVLTDQTEFMISGENIRAQAMQFSLATPESVIQARYPEIYRLQQVMNNAMNPRTDARVRTAFARLGIEAEQFELMKDTINEAIEMVKHTLKLQNNDAKANISGTSMATPSVASLAMLEFSEKLLKSGKFYYQVYGEPGFTPTDIIQDLVKKSILVRIGNDNNKTNSLEKQQRFLPESEEEIRLRTQLNKSRSSNVLCQRFYGVTMGKKAK
ncbi:MAG: S8 family serine peptidase [Bdellovibrionaceae bacterium]|nr:S8 family serine peptidase [Pseudobdellovibrionaceae bacterium]